MERLLKKSKSWYLLAVFVADIIFFGATDPTTAPSILLVTGFILLVATFYIGVSLLIEEANSPPGKLSRNKKSFIVILTVLVAFLLAMQSIGQLSTNDVLAVICLGALFFVYMAYFTNKH